LARKSEHKKRRKKDIAEYLADAVDFDFLLLC
jgi:hypothetical protein